MIRVMIRQRGGGGEELKEEIKRERRSRERRGQAKERDVKQKRRNDNEK